MFHRTIFTFAGGSSIFKHALRNSQRTGQSMFSGSGIERPFQQFRLLSANTHKTDTAVQTAANSALPTDYDERIRKIRTLSVRDVTEKKVFAVVHIAGKQFKITPNDVIMINKKIEAECGDLIRLEKVLAAGSRVYTLLGQPLLKRDMVNIKAIVMEKTKGEKKIAFKKKRRKGYKRWKGHRQDLSVLKIKSISLDTSQL